MQPVTRGHEPPGNLVHERFNLGMSRMLRVASVQGKCDTRGGRSPSNTMECWTRLTLVCGLIYRKS